MALLSLLLTSTTGCFDDVKLGDVEEPTSQPYFSMTYAGAVGSDLGEGDFSVSISFVAPETWEVMGDGTRNFPAHVILSGAEGWQRSGSTWTSYPDVDFLLKTLLSFAPALEGLHSDLRSAGSGPRYFGEATRKYVRTVSSEDELMAAVIRDSNLPPDIIATLTTTYSDLVTKMELHVGVDSKLVYFIKTSRQGPNTHGGTTYTFDYETPVSITAPR